eukprot:jgi/Chlat1/4439/Chrsp29S04404
MRIARKAAELLQHCRPFCAFIQRQLFIRALTASPTPSVRTGVYAFTAGAVLGAAALTTLNAHANGSTLQAHALSLPPAQPLSRHFIADAVEKVAPAVVNIRVAYGLLEPLGIQQAGSGAIINENGTVLTNAHVVAPEAGFRNNSRRAAEITVSLQDGRTFPGRVLSSDTLSDLALVKIDAETPLPVAHLGSSEKLRAGEWVVALGSPLSLQNSVSCGIISNVERKGSDMGLRGISTDYLQTDAAINQGNSGGPLVNLDGEVIGINAMKSLAADGISFAIPIDAAKRVIAHLQQYGRVKRPLLGVKLLELNPSLAEQLRKCDSSFPPDISAGVLVAEVRQGSVAELAGLRVGDIIADFNRKPVTSTRQVMNLLMDNVGNKVQLGVQRGRKRVSASLLVEEAVSV